MYATETYQMNSSVFDIGSMQLLQKLRYLLAKARIKIIFFWRFLTLYTKYQNEARTSHVCWANLDMCKIDLSYIKLLLFSDELLKLDALCIQ